MDAGKLRIERLTTIDQFHACERLQREAWGMGDRDVVPLHLLVTFQRNGGLVLGAFDEGGEMVGTLFGFLGVREGCARTQKRRSLGRSFKHCSHMMGVREDWRGRGVGHRLKLAQREHALRQGLRLVTWTFDPLESLNASLNVRKLGAVCNTYVRDLYGDMDDERNAGLGSDRFQLDWWIASHRVKRRLDGTDVSPTRAALADRGAVLLNPAEVDPSGRLLPTGEALAPTAETVLVEIPSDIQATKAADVDLARRWRSHARGAFEGCFASGYTVVDFVSERPSSEAPRAGDRRSFYVLQRGFEAD
jgi:predicted GNAT superfamily acetyltransferase